MDSKDGKLKHRKNRTNNCDAKMFAEGTSELVAFFIFHFAPLAFANMSNHVSKAPLCQLGNQQARTEHAGVPITGMALNGDLTCE